MLVASFVVLLLHEFEEWGWPGGEPAVLNKVIFNSGKLDRYPLNANSAMIVNVFAAYPLYIAAVIFSDAIWLGLLAAFLFWVAQFAFHGILTTKKLRYLYNQGCSRSSSGDSRSVPTTSTTSSRATWRACGTGSELPSSWSRSS